MANNDIYVKVDHNNLIYVDPNSVVIGNQVKPRTIEQENLVMYVNLEADMISRSFLFANTTNSNDKGKMSHIAGGKLNFLKKQSGQDFSTEWTDVFTESKQSGGSMDIDITGQSFGIKDINIVVKGANFIPQIVINFVDVRGKVLFDSPKDSPYAAFFNLPWPIFYLTIKGYFGKAIKYRLHMVKFNNKFNGSTGNFETTATFVGSTYAYMSDIPLSAIMNSPYMFLKEKQVTVKTNGKDDTITTVISKDTKGHQMLKSVYDEMKAKKLIPKDFPVITLRELQIIAESLDKRLGETIFKRVITPELIMAIKNYGKTLGDLTLAIKGWISVNVGTTKEIIQGKDYYYLSIPNNLSKAIIGKTTNGSLEYLLSSFNEKLLINSDFTKIPQADRKVKVETNMFTKKMSAVNSYYKFQYGNYLINKDQLLSDINEIKRVYTEQSEKIYKKIESEMNTFLKSKESGIGFDPTLRNVLAIILSNADVYIRLLKETHTKAYEVSNERKERIRLFDGETQNAESVFPWPQIKKKSKNTGAPEFAYPGDPEIREILGATDGRLWPEVLLIEEFVKASTFKSDPSDKEGGKGNINFIMESDEDTSYINEISTLFINEYPYSEKTITSFIYEIAERAKYITYIDSFGKDIIEKLADLESKTINKISMNELELSSILFNNLKTKSNLEFALAQYSENKRYLNFTDSIPTTEYIEQCIVMPFSIEKYEPTKSNFLNNGQEYAKINKLLIETYSPETYRANIYPFNSDTYLSYTQGKSTIEDLKIKNTLKISSSNEFISSAPNPKMWIKSEYFTGSTLNMFSQSLNIGLNYTNILNTPYFHKQLHDDFHNTLYQGKYAGSAYLLLNSLPYYDLEDIINVGDNPADVSTKIRMSSLFREVGATHYIPYHLLLKWGAIYHRYKKKIKTGEDIIVSGITDQINFHQFFNNGTDETYTIGTTTIGYDDNTNLGFHPYHDAVYSQIVNGFNHFDITPGSGSTLNNNVNLGAVIINKQTISTNTFWSMVVDNSKFIDNDLRYTLLPTNGCNKYYNLGAISEDSNFRSIWEDEFITNNYTGVTFPAYNEYNRSLNTTERTIDNKYSLSNNYRKCVDLIGTFSPKILEALETMFLDFSTEMINVEKQYETYESVSYNKFQKLLKDLSTVEKLTTDGNNELLFKNLKKRHKSEIENISQLISGDSNLLKVTIGNPKEIDPYVIEGFTLGENTFTYGAYNSSQLVDNAKYIELYIGEDIDLNYSKFFENNNVELSESNVLKFRPIIQIYAGYLKNGVGETPVFTNYLNNNIIIPAKKRYDQFLIEVMSGISETKKQNLPAPINYTDGYEMNKLKVELYSSFKSFNDKWAAGNSIGEKLLIEEFLFLDKANRDIGQRAYINLDRIKSLLSPKNIKKDLYSIISMLLQGTGFDMRALPSYVNFYGVSSSSSSQVSSATKTANDLFGTFVDVDYEESSPKIIIQYVDAPSSHLEMVNQNSLFKSDTYNIGEINNNSTLLTMPTLFSKEEMELSNKVVAFEVNFGDSEQNIFKEIDLNQESIRNTSESFVVLEALGSNESGGGSQSVDTQLFEYYRQAAYSCEITCMGNVMIQPTMYFYLNNVPMFKGTYWITEVSHTLGEGSFKTTFKGSRMPAPSFPSLEDSFMATYRSLMERVQQQAIAKIEKESVTMDETAPKISQAKKINTNKVSSDELPVITNIENPDQSNINRVLINGVKYYEAKVVEMGSLQYPIADDQLMSVISDHTTRNTWGNLKLTKSLNLFYSTRIFEAYNKKELKYEDVINGTTQFYNPKTRKTFPLPHSYHFSPSLSVNGIVNNGPWNLPTNEYGIGMSQGLMRALKVKNGDSIYFRILTITN